MNIQELYNIRFQRKDMHKKVFTLYDKEQTSHFGFDCKALSLTNAFKWIFIWGAEFNNSI